MASVPLRRLATPDDVADACLFLASPLYMMQLYGRVLNSRSIETLRRVREECGSGTAIRLKTVIMAHVPPYDSGLDTAPLLSPDLRPTVSAGDVLRGPVGSTGVRRAIESFRPVLSVHGHIHESGGERRIGDTVALNAGSEANHGILRGYLVDRVDQSTAECSLARR